MEIVNIAVLTLLVFCFATIVDRKSASKAERIRIAKEKEAEEERIRIAKEKEAEEERIRIAKEKAVEEERIRKAKEILAAKEKNRKFKVTKKKDIKELRITNQYCPACKELVVDVFTDGSGECGKCNYTSVRHVNEPLPSSLVELDTDKRERSWW